MSLSRSVDLVGPDGRSKARAVLEVPAAVAPSDAEARDRNRVRRETRLPILLAGPLVRRLEPGSVWIWLATSVPVGVTAEVREAAARAPLAPEAIGTGNASSFQVGGRLHVTLVQVAARVRPPGTSGRFPTERVLVYNLRLTTTRPELFFDGEVLLYPREVALRGQELPSFFVPAPGRANVRFLHGSCRKFHGRGRDAIPLALAALESAADNASQRPTHLLLTGDQIYADDVARDVIEKLRWFGLELMARREFLPAERRSTAQLGPGERGAVVSRGGFTSGEAENHLLGLGEFAGMYLAAWSPEVWSHLGLTQTTRVIDPGEPGPPRIPRREIVVVREEDTSVEMRRLLANIPSYMIFDDHEITDDWNLTYEWLTRVASNPNTRRVVSNGLAAFAAFQALGNAPEHAAELQSRVAENPVMLGDASPERAAASGPPGLGTAQWHDFDLLLWGFDDWAFVAEMQPRVIFLDTRTQRLLEREWAPNRERVAGLMAPRALERLARHLRGVGGHADEPVVLVSPAPVIGYALEEFQHTSANVDRVNEPLDPASDPEAWSFHRRSFVTFLDALMDSGRRRFVFLSGDVHYAYTAVAQFSRRQRGTTRRIDMVQFTSSSLRNEPSGGQAVGLRQAIDRLVNDAGDVQIRLGWDSGRPTEHPTIAAPGSFTANALRNSPWDFELRWRYARGTGTSHTVVTAANVGLVELALGAGAASAKQTLLHHGGRHETHVDWARVDGFLGR